VNPQHSFGERLRRERERRGITLDTIAQTTKITSSLLVGLERGDCSRWPGGVYSRAYVRSYAESLGLDSKAIAEEFGRCFPAIAWPDAARPVSADTAEVESLRLTLEPMPSDRWRRLRSGVSARLILCGAAVVIAGVASLAGMDFWMALSAASLTAQVRHLV
jgi:cytoskeletal protein RodZ